MARYRKRIEPAPMHAELPAAVTGVGPIQLVNRRGLHPLSTRPSLVNYVEQLWARRFFIFEDAKSKALRSTREYRLWRTWLVVSPLFDVVLYGFLFGLVFKTSRGVPNFVGFLFIGVIFMKMMGALMLRGSGLIASSRAMIRAFSFPRAAIPLAQALRGMIDNALPAIVGLLAAFCVQWGTWPRWTLIWVLPLYVLIHIFGCGLMMIVARLTCEIPDIKAILNLINQAWFFLSGVMYTADRFDHLPVAQELMTHNPGYIFLTAVRDTTIYGTSPSSGTWLSLFAWSIGTFVVGFVFFWAAEEKYVRLV